MSRRLILRSWTGRNRATIRLRPTRLCTTKLRFSTLSIRRSTRRPALSHISRRWPVRSPSARSRRRWSTRTTSKHSTTISAATGGSPIGWRSGSMRHRWRRLLLLLLLLIGEILRLSPLSSSFLQLPSISAHTLDLAAQVVHFILLRARRHDQVAHSTDHRHEQRTQLHQIHRVQLSRVDRRRRLRPVRRRRRRLQLLVELVGSRGRWWLSVNRRRRYRLRWWRGRLTDRRQRRRRLRIARQRPQLRCLLTTQRPLR